MKIGCRVFLLLLRTNYFQKRRPCLEIISPCPSKINCGTHKPRTCCYGQCLFRFACCQMRELSKPFLQDARDPVCFLVVAETSGEEGKTAPQPHPSSETEKLKQSVGWRDAREAWIAEKFPGAPRKRQFPFLDSGDRLGARGEKKILKILSEKDVLDIYNSVQLLK